MPDYASIAAQIAALTRDVPYQVANLSNTAALLWQELEDINWVGFYKLMDDTLVLYPFQGKPACIAIAPGKGVCGAAAAQDAVILVEDVHRFPGHIACDSASRSEIVLPLHADGRLWGVLDIDSPSLGRFTQADREGLEIIRGKIENFL